MHEERPAGQPLAEMLANENLSIRELQRFHEALDREKRFDTDVFRNVAYLAGEIGEVVTALRALSRANEPNRETARDEVGAELADCLAYVVKLANYAGVDLQGAYAAKMARNLARDWHGKRAGAPPGEAGNRG